MTLPEKEQRVLTETRLRNLKRKYSKLLQRPEFAEECIDLKNNYKNAHYQNCDDNGFKKPSEPVLENRTAHQRCKNYHRINLNYRGTPYSI